MSPVHVRSAARIAAGAALVALSVACTADDAGAQQQGAEMKRDVPISSSRPVTADDLVRPQATPVPVAPAPAGAVDPAAVPKAMLDGTRADLDRRLAAAGTAGAVRLVAAEAVTWNDGSLGCPQPGRMYTMALVPGFRVVYAVATAQGERQYAYHAGASGAWSYCENPVAALPGAATM